MEKLIEKILDYVYMLWCVILCKSEFYDPFEKITHLLGMNKNCQYTESNLWQFVTVEMGISLLNKQTQDNTEKERILTKYLQSEKEFGESVLDFANALIYGEEEA